VACFGLLDPHNLQAAVDGGITLAQATYIADLWTEVVNAQDELERATDSDKVSKEKDLQLAQMKLSNAVNYSSFRGNTMEAVSFAVNLLNQNNLIEELENELKEKSKESDGWQVKVLKEKIDIAKKELDNTIKSQDQQSKLKALADSRFRGFGFGIALGVTVDLGTNDRIENASIDANNIVRVDKEQDIQANFILETHIFLLRFALFGYGPKAGDWGWGPFVAVQPGSDDIIDAAGIGLMLGMKRAQIFLKGYCARIRRQLQFRCGLHCESQRTNIER
jgi:hypothetical protein